MLAYNRDDHARQFSFVMEHDGTWRKAPAYDRTWSPGPAGEHSSSILGQGKDITRDHLINLGNKAEMKAQEVSQVLGLTAYFLPIRPANAKKLLPIAAKARPWILIAVGLLILMDTGFDSQ